MVAARFLTPLLCAITAGVIATDQSACAGNPPLWQPYRPAPHHHVMVPARKVGTPIDPSAIVPQQFIVPAPPDGIPIEALTDAELDQLSACCGESFNSVKSHFDPIIDKHLKSLSTGASASNGSLKLLPGDVIWHSYWAGAKEPRTAGTFFKETGNDLSLLDVTLGGRSSLLRDATQNDQGLWHGWELQIEGAANLRLNLDENGDLDATDFRFGVPFILARNQLHWKIAYYHLSSHVGDEFLVRNPGFSRINFSRDVLVLGASYFPLPSWRYYAEAGWAFYDDEGSAPWELQLGLDYAQPGPTGACGIPFFALNGHLREEVDFGGNLAIQAGWLWRGHAGRVLRTGLHYYNGKSSQFEFFDQFEQHIGFGLWQEY